MKKKKEPPFEKNPKSLSGDDLNVYIDTLQRKESPHIPPIQEEAMVVKNMIILTADDSMNADFSMELEKQIVSTYEAKQKKKWLKKIALPLFVPTTIAAVASLIFFTSTDSQKETTETAKQEQKNETKEAAQEWLVGTAVLSENEIREKIAPPENGYTIDMQEFEQVVKMHNTNNLVEVESDGAPIIQSDYYIPPSSPTKKEPKEDMLYTRLRKTAFSIIASEEKIIALLADGGMDTTVFRMHVQNFEYQIDQWPVDTSPFDPDAYAKAVNQIVAHNTEWNRLIKIATDAIIEEYNKSNE